MPREFIETLRYVNHRQFVITFREIDGRGGYPKIGCKRGRRVVWIRRAWAINQDSHDNEIQCFGTGCVRRVLSKAPIYLSYKTVWEQFAHKRHRRDSRARVARLAPPSTAGRNWDTEIDGFSFILVKFPKILPTFINFVNIFRWRCPDTQASRGL